MNDASHRCYCCDLFGGDHTEWCPMNPNPPASRPWISHRLRVWAEAVIDGEKADVDRGNDGWARISQRVAVEAAEDILALLSVGERDKAEIERLSGWADQYEKALVRIVDARSYEARDIARVALRHPDNAAHTWAERERDRQRIERLTEQVERLLDCRGGGKGTVSVMGGDPAVCEACAEIARAVLADKEDAHG